MAAVQPLHTVPKLRIICFNIHHGEGIHGELDLARVSAVIRASARRLRHCRKSIAATASTQLPAVQVLKDDSRLLPHIQMTLILMINESLARERPCNQMVSTRSSALYALCSGEKNGFIIRLLPRRLQMLLLLLLLLLLMQPR